VRHAALLLGAFVAYRLVRGAVDDPQGATTAFEHARAIIDLERDLGVFVEPAIQGWAVRTGWVDHVAAWLYVNAQTTVTVGALTWIALRHRAAFALVRTTFVLAFALALAGYWLLPTAPPRLLPEWGFRDSVAAVTGVQTDGPLVNPYAAVPSMHVGFAMMVGLPLARLSRRRAARALWAAYPLLVTFVIVATANHFLADAVLGALTVALAFAGARALAAARRRPALAPTT
jgi:small-conductance mechanosensitive channel